MAAGLIDRIAELTDRDDSIAGEAQMDTLVSLISGASSIGSTEETLIVTALMATPKKLLRRFSHSAALVKVEQWLTQSAAAEENGRTTQLLHLLGRMPMSIQALTDSGLGKPINRLRKLATASAEVKSAAASLYQDWKSLAAEAPAPAASTAASGAKRALSTDGAADKAADKRAKSASPSSATRSRERCTRRADRRACSCTSIAPGSRRGTFAPT